MFLYSTWLAWLWAKKVGDRHIGKCNTKTKILMKPKSNKRRRRRKTTIPFKFKSTLVEGNVYIDWNGAMPLDMYDR